MQKTMNKTVFVGVIGYRKGDEVECVGVWNDRAQAVKDISAEHTFNSDFSDPNDGYWGTEEWTITLEEQKVR
jgi:hypothetical protein